MAGTDSGCARIVVRRIRVESRVKKWNFSWWKVCILPRGKRRKKCFPIGIEEEEEEAEWFFFRKKSTGVPEEKAEAVGFG